MSSIKAQMAPSIIADSLQAILDRSLPTGVTNPGAVLGVSVPGKWSWYGASGKSIAGITNGYPAVTANPTDKFRVGSISKTFTAVAILKLEQAGLLSTNDTIGKFLRPSLIYDTIKSSSPVSILELLNHTSGIANSADNMACQQNVLNNLTSYHSLEEGINCGASQGEDFPPNFTWGYSNTNYSILAMIIEKITGQSYDDYITQNIITPLNLTNTEVPDNDQISGNHLGCYWPTGGPLLDLTIIDPSVYMGWANIVSTAADLNTFFTALRNGNILNPASLTKMMTIAPSAWNYGLGIEFYPIYGTNYFGHSGEVANTSGMFFLDTITAYLPNGYYISYNFNYQGVDITTKIDEAVYTLLVNEISSMTAIAEQSQSLRLNKTYPNPSSSELNIEYSSSKNSNCEIAIYTSEGTLLKTIVVNSLEDTNTLKIDLENFSSGIYTYSLKDKSTICYGKFAVIK